MSSPNSVFVESPLQDDVRHLVAALNAYMKPLSPPQFQFQMTVEQMDGDDTTVFVARNEAGQAVGMGALKAHGNDLGEVKRMFTMPEVRGQRVGVLLLETIVAQAEKMNMNRLVLETGTERGFAPAWRLYENGGFARCGVVLDYPDSGYSAFFERVLTKE